MDIKERRDFLYRVVGRSESSKSKVQRDSNSSWMNWWLSQKMDSRISDVMYQSWYSTSWDVESCNDWLGNSWEWNVQNLCIRLTARLHVEWSRSSYSPSLLHAVSLCLTCIMKPLWGLPLGLAGWWCNDLNAILLDISQEIHREISVSRRLVVM